MTKSFVRIINELSEVSSISDKERLSTEASRALTKNQGYAESILTPILGVLKRSIDSKNFEKISEGEFYELEIRSYRDTDSLLRISVQVSFLQDFDNVEDSLSEKVAAFLYSELLKRNLDIIVNDICINDVQYRNNALK